VNELQIFYREAGPAAAPVVLLLHGFPTSSRMFRNLMPMLADKYRVIAPDYPAFGHSAVPSRSDFHYTHVHLSEVVEALIEKLGIARFAMYLMDFGGPIGYRLMLKYPDRVTGVVVQNAPTFGEPTDGPLWAAELAYWKDGSPAHRDGVRSKLTPEAVRNQYLSGMREPSLIDPDNWTIDSALLARPGVDEIMLDLLYDIRNNRQTVADARQFFKAHQGQMMIASGVNDPLFPGAGMKPPGIPATSAVLKCMEQFLPHRPGRAATPRLLAGMVSQARRWRYWTMVLDTGSAGGEGRRIALSIASTSISATISATSAACWPFRNVSGDRKRVVL
jgi:pimeloyl-ACP methyl ester carboxylesterase